MKSLVNKRFGRLIAVEFVGKDKYHQTRWSCMCDCGTVTHCWYSSLISGATKSCGCYNREVCSKSKLHGEAHVKKRTAEYNTWLHVKDRCLNPNNTAYNYYGGRGISVCARWKKNYLKFLKDMGRKPSSQYSIDRINSDGNYEPKNCRWATKAEQTLNRRCVSKIAAKLASKGNPDA